LRNCWSLATSWAGQCDPVRWRRLVNSGPPNLFTIIWVNASFAAYDLRKIRGKKLVDKPGRSRRYQLPPAAARTIAALLTLRDHVIAPILAGVRSPRMGRKPKIWTPIDRDYEQIRINMQTLFSHLGLITA
jgi:hypothetical protein